MFIWFELGSVSCSVLPTELVYNISDLFKDKLTSKGLFLTLSGNTGRMAGGRKWPWSDKVLLTQRKKAKGRPEKVISEKPWRICDSNGSQRKERLLKGKCVSNLYVTFLLTSLKPVSLKNRMGRKADSTIFTSHRWFLDLVKINQLG